MPHERLSKWGMKAPASSHANTNVYSVNHPCGMSKRVDSPVHLRSIAEHPEKLLSPESKHWDFGRGGGDRIHDQHAFVNCGEERSRFQQEAQKIQVLHLVSLRNQKATLSLPQLYRSCTELPEHTVLCRFPPCIRGQTNSILQTP